MRIHYNAPVTLTFCLICALILLLDRTLLPSVIKTYFTTFPQFSPMDILSWIRSVGHIFGHADMGHLMGNLTYLLLLGPILEEKYGSRDLMIMMVCTAVVTAVLNAMFLSTALHGASGIVFMFILLSSFANRVSGTIPLTFVLLATLYLGSEVAQAFGNNNISQFAHIVGGLAGAFFGYITDSGKSRT